jgi:hypothetical protein
VSGFACPDTERYDTALELVGELRVCGVTFRIVDGRVRYRPLSRVTEHGRAELKRCKDEVHEILREEEAHEAWLANRPEEDPLPDDEYNEFKELSDEQQAALCGWIARTLEVDPDRRPSSYHTSYHLKHVFERSPDGFYVSDEQFRCAMWLSGFLGRRVPGSGASNKDVGTRYYYVRPNREGFVEKLVDYAGVPRGWAWEAVMGVSEVEGIGAA